MGQLINGICEKHLPVVLTLSGDEAQDVLIYPNADISNDLVLFWENKTKCLKMDVKTTDDFIVRCKGSGDESYFNMAPGIPFFIAPPYHHYVAIISPDQSPHTDFYLSNNFLANTLQPGKYIDGHLTLEVDFLTSGHVSRSYSILVNMFIQMDANLKFEFFSTYTIEYRKDIIGKFITP